MDFYEQKTIYISIKIVKLILNIEAVNNTDICQFFAYLTLMCH